MQNKTTTYLSLIILILLSNLIAKAQNKMVQKPITIVSQGNFSAGGSVIKSEGVFDPLKPWNVR